MMTQADVDAARKAMLQRRQAAYEAFFNAVVAADSISKKAAKQALSDIQDEEDALNNIQGLIAIIAAMP